MGDSDTPVSDTLELDLRALPVSMLPMFLYLAMGLDTSTIMERGRLRLSPTSDTLVLDTPDTVSDSDTESTPAMSVCAPTIWELASLAKKLRYLQENMEMWEFYWKNYEIKF